VKNQAVRLLMFCIILGFVCKTSAQKLDLPADKKATKETVQLYRNLKKLAVNGFLFGHQDDLAYGVNWKNQQNRSDVKETAGDYPAVYGWELGRLEIDASVNLDSVPFVKMKQWIKQGYSRGGVITISWHLNNPLTGKSAWDAAPAGSVAAALPGGKSNNLYKSWLDKVANFMKSLKGKNGEYIPVIFRPFHELNGSWFWWGGSNCTATEIQELYRFTEKYLRDQKGVHNVLYAFNTDRFATKEAYLERYPGDEYVDVVGFDIYQKADILSNDKFLAELDNSLTILADIATTKNKILALTEFGFNQLPDPEWWTEILYKALAHHPVAYVLAWRNAGRKSTDEIEFYAPYKGQASEQNFKKFYQLERVLFEKKALSKKLYQ
jgi:hypothetical protein